MLALERTSPRLVPSTVTAASLSRERRLIVSHGSAGGSHSCVPVRKSIDGPSWNRSSIRQASQRGVSSFHRNVGAAISGGKTDPSSGSKIVICAGPAAF